jgi:endonuclease/exonuclease/phosphatase family metal-dependent hydrolase
MPTITDPPPGPLAQKLAEIGTAIEAGVPAKELDRNLLIGTWNLRAFGGLTDKWRAEEKDSPKRDLFDVLCIAEIASRFDVIAIQEVRGDLRALRHLLKKLGPDWGVIMTDVTQGPEGNNERMAFIFDTRRVKPSGLAAELVVWIESDGDIRSGALDRQFARTPYAVSFLSAGRTFTLVTLHVVYGKSAGDRVGELREIARWLARWAEQEEDWKHNVIALGDFNIDRRGDPLYDAFTATGLQPAPGLNDVPRTIFDRPGKSSFYDQVAWFTEPGTGPVLDLAYSAAGSFDFVPHLLEGLTTSQLSWKISDHYPLWTEFSVRP